MKKIISFLFGILVVMSCSTESDSNGNSSTTVVPVSPTNLTGIAASPTQINLSWTDNSTNETGFKIQRRTGSESYTVVGTVNEDALTFSDSGLTPSTTYIYRVYSYNSAGNSPTYSNEVNVTTTTTGINILGPNATDIDGNVYASISNCNQTWTQRNLNVSKYSDGTPIPQVTNATQWANLTTGAWCYYNNDPASEAVYGKLYNWYAAAGIYDAASAANPALRKKLAPIGWHVPSDEEWSNLINCLDPAANGGENFNIAGGKMKSTGTLQAGTGLWYEPNTEATNGSGFSGLPGGLCDYYGAFVNIGNYGYWWSSSEDGTIIAFFRYLNSSFGGAYRLGVNSRYGFSVRCLRD